MAEYYSCITFLLWSLNQIEETNKSESGKKREAKPASRKTPPWPPCALQTAHAGNPQT